MLAIVDLNGKQYQVEEGRYVTVDRLALDEESTFDLSNILMVVDGEESLVGAPFVDGALVKAKVLRHTRGPKVLVYKMRCKKGYRRKNGHRQDFTQLQIVSVDFPGKKEKPAKSAEEKQEKKQPKKETAKKAAPKAKKAEVSAESTEASA